MQASLRWNDDGGGMGFVVIPTASLPFLTNYLTSAPSVIYGQEVLYAAKGHAYRT